MKSLQGKVALVAGASRGAGRGIAYELGEAGATVYVTGRSVNGAITDNRKESIEETAEGVSKRGGRGIAVRCDHTHENDVQKLFNQIKQEQGRLDLLVNSVFGGSEDSLAPKEGPNFWQRPFEQWDAMMNTPKACLLTNRYAVPLMSETKNGLIVNITFLIKDKILGNLYYDIAMNAVNRMTLGMANELKLFGITTVALCPGWMRTERVIDSGFGVEDGATETTAYVGRAVVCLAADPFVSNETGSALMVAELARRYNFTDIDGTQPNVFK
jgi:NAD(P)-dependent dehydrogenase (short-subunit alcohol dehydrogenase family)